MDNKGAILICFLLFGFVSIQAQNHLSNGNFESFSVVPTNFSQWYYLYGGWNAANGCVPGSPNCGTPDFYHTAGYSVGPAASGNAYVGLFTNYTISSSALNYREYISAEMTPWLDSGQVYLVSFFVKAHKLYTHSTYSNNLGVHINRNFATQNSIEPMSAYEPQYHIEDVITHEDWVRYRFLFYADTVYRSITLGNFYADSNTIVTPGGGPNNTSAYYLIDSVRVELFNYDLQVSGDTTEKCGGIPVVLSASGDIDYQWATAGAPGVVFDTASVITVYPDTTTTYLLYGAFDTVSITIQVLTALNIRLGADTTICSGDSIYLDIEKYDYPAMWSDGDTSHYKLVVQAGTYEVEVADSNSCSYYASISVDVVNCDTTSAGGLSQNTLQQVSIYPNPSNMNGWYIDGLGIETTEIHLYNSQGRLIHRSVIKPNSTDPYKLEGPLEPGLYYLQVQKNKTSRTYKLVCY